MSIQSSNIPSDISLGEAISLSPKFPKDDFQGMRYFAGALAKQQAAKAKAAAEEDEKYRKYLDNFKITDAPDIQAANEMRVIAAKHLSEQLENRTKYPHTFQNSAGGITDQRLIDLEEAKTLGNNRNLLRKTDSELLPSGANHAKELLNQQINSKDIPTDEYYSPSLGRDITNNNGQISIQTIPRKHDVFSQIDKNVNDAKLQSSFIANNVPTTVIGNDIIKTEYNSVPRTRQDANERKLLLAKTLNRDPSTINIVSAEDIAEQAWQQRDTRLLFKDMQRPKYMDDQTGKMRVSPDELDKKLHEDFVKQVEDMASVKTKENKYYFDPVKNQYFALKIAGESENMPHATTTINYIPMQDKDNFIKNFSQNDSFNKSYEAQTKEYKDTYTKDDYSKEIFDKVAKENPILFSNKVTRIDNQPKKSETQEQSKDWDDGKGGTIKGALKAVVITEDGTAYAEIIKDATQIEKERESKKLSKTTSEKVISSIDYVPITNTNDRIGNLGRITNERKGNKELHTEISKAEKTYPNAFKNTSSKSTEPVQQEAAPKKSKAPRPQ